MSTLPKSRLRIAGDLFRFDRLVDLLRPSHTNQFEEEIPLLPRFHGADSLQVEIAIFNNGVLQHNLSSIASLELVIKPLSVADAAAANNSDSPNPDAQRGPASNVLPIVCKRISNEHFNPAMTDGQWQSKAANMAHAIITLDSEEAALSPGERWLSLIALGNDGQARTLAAGPILILGGGPTFNALPQPIVKDLRDQAAASAAQALNSADNAAASAQGAANATLAAQEQVALAALSATQAASSATQANTAVTTAQNASAQSTEARNEAQQHAAQAQSSARLAEQTASEIGDLSAALTQAGADASRAEAAAATAENERWAAAAYAAMLNPQTKLAAGGIYKESTATITLEQPVTLGLGDFDILAVVSNVARAQTEQDALLAAPSGDRALVAYSPASGAWYVRDNTATVRLSAVRAVPSDALLRLSRAGDALSLTIDGELIAEVTGIATVDFGQLHFVGCRNSAGTGFGWQGTLRNLCVFNRALDASEASELTGSGGQTVPVTTRRTHAAGAFYLSDFSDSTSGWSNIGGSVNFTTGDTQAGQTNVLTMTAATNGEVRMGLTNQTGMWVPDKTSRISLRVYIPTTNATTDGIVLTTNSASRILLDARGLEKGTWQTLSATFVFSASMGNANAVYLRQTAGTSITGPSAGDWVGIKDIVIEQLGCVLNLPASDGSGYQLRDYSTSSNHALLSASGCTHLLPSRNFEFVWTRVSSGFLADADRPVLPDGAVIDSIIWEDAKPTRTAASLGYNASNTTTHLASWTPAQARQKATLTAGSIAAADRRLYLQMGAAAGAVTLRVSGHVL